MLQSLVSQCEKTYVLYVSHIIMVFFIGLEAQVDMYQECMQVKAR